jgi:hypothetical protein
VCRYNSNPTAGSEIKVVSTFANSQSNNGVLMEFDVGSDNNLGVFQVVPRIRIADTTLTLESFYVNIQKLYMHTLTFSRQNGNYIAKYTVTTIDEKNALMNDYKNTLSVTSPIYFSNRNIEIGDDTVKTSPISLYAVGFAKRALDSKEILELGKYFQGIDLKLSALAMNMYGLYGEVTMCPYDKPTCDACVNVNLANPNNVLLAKADCKTALNKYCSAHPNDIGCECYKKENEAEPYCGYWKKMLQGAPTLCSIGEQVAASSLLNTTASTALIATAATSTNTVTPTCPVSQAPPKPVGFWEIMSNILGYSTNATPIQPPKLPACPTVSQVPTVAPQPKTTTSQVPTVVPQPKTTVSSETTQPPKPNLLDQDPFGLRKYIQK